MKVSRKWIAWAHGPGADDGQPLATRLVALAHGPGRGAVDIHDLTLIGELIDVAELYRFPRRGDSLFDMGAWWMGQPRKVVQEGRAALLALHL